jgi:hypothetical protein
MATRHDGEIADLRRQARETKRRPVHKGAGLHKEGRRRFGGILSLLIRYIPP